MKLFAAAASRRAASIDRSITWGTLDITFATWRREEFLRDAISFEIRELSLGLPALGLSPFPNWCNFGLAIGAFCKEGRGTQLRARTFALWTDLEKAIGFIGKRRKLRAGRRKSLPSKGDFRRPPRTRGQNGHFQGIYRRKNVPFYGRRRYGRRRRQERREPSSLLARRACENAGSASEHRHLCDFRLGHNRVAIEDKENKCTLLLMATAIFSLDLTSMPCVQHSVMALPKFASFLPEMTIKIAACERQRERLPPSFPWLAASGIGAGHASMRKIKGK